MQSIDADAVGRTEEQKEEAKLLFLVAKWGSNPVGALSGVIEGDLI